MTSTPNRKYLRFWPLVMVIVLLFLSVFVSRVVTTATFSPFIARHVEHVLHRKVQYLDKQMDAVLSENMLNESVLHNNTGDYLRKDLNKNGIALFIYHKDSLVYWSDNTIPLDKLDPHHSLSAAVIFAGNGWFLPESRVSGDTTLIGMVLIKYHYQVNNQYLKSDFFRGSWLGDHYNISSIPEEGGIAIHDKDGNYIFSISVKNGEEQPLFWRWISFIFFFAALLLSFFWGIGFVSRNPKIHPLIRLAVVALILLLFHLGIVDRWMPPQFFNLTLFSPFYFALASWCPSIGDLFFLCILLFFLFYTFWIVGHEDSHRVRGWLSFTGLLLATVLLVATVELLYQLVMSSSLVFEPFRILDISIYSILGYLSVGFLFIAFLLMLDNVLYHSTFHTPWKFLGKLFVVSLIFPALLIIKGFHVPWFTVFLLWLCVAVLYWGKKRSVSISIFLIALFVGLYATILILSYADQRREQNAQLLAINLAAEHDPVAELLMGELNSSLQQDQEIQRMMSKSNFTQTDADLIKQYLKMRYFNGYWDKYDLWVYLCTPTSSLLSDASLHPCFSFFRSLMADIGTQISGTVFQFLDTQNGLISYLGELYFPGNTAKDTNGLFIQLNSKVLYEQLGYPELLIDEGDMGEFVPEEFIYAKYYNGNLVTQKGDFPFPISDKDYVKSNGDEFALQEFGGYEHVIFRPNGATTMVMSYQKHSFVDYLISFAYLFVFVFLLLMLSLFRTVFPIGFPFGNLMLKQKIQLWIISLMLFIFLLVGAGTIFFSKQQFYENHLANLREKLKSVYVELEHKLSMETSLDQNWQSEQYASLNDLLVKFSNVFYTDINLYTEEGSLLATSRPEIFEKNLMSPRMNEMAYYQLRQKMASEYVHREHLGHLSYLSAYTPFFNQDNDLLAYLNLPYFTKQSTLTREISNMIVGIINSWMILILISVALAVFISDKITNPLRQLQEKIGKFKLGSEYEHIVYTGNDEIGELVREYNRMIDELSRNIALLAKSERESAWREMARQIAHEIKNPLTPMKLSIQQLKRSWDDKRDDFDQHIHKVAGTLIEQIDRLSSIATAFSNFARLPKTHYEPVSLIALLTDVVNLFSGDCDIILDFDKKKKELFMVYADKQELNSVFVNLVKNALQSLQEGRRGKIELSVVPEEENDSQLIVSVSDNGAGIPEGLGDRLFEPNFTTKSSGMGLGLAIVKKIVEDMKGDIWYASNKSGGTTFFIKLPVYIPDQQEK